MSAAIADLSLAAIGFGFNLDDDDNPARTCIDALLEDVEIFRRWAEHDDGPDGVDRTIVGAIDRIGGRLRVIRELVNEAQPSKAVAS